jgi:hypothetical protein
MKKVAKEIVKIAKQITAAKMPQEDYDALPEAARDLIDELGEDEAQNLMKEIGYGLEDVDKFEEKRHGEGYTLSIGNKEWLGFKSYDDAEKEAIERVTNDLENEPSLFNQDWLLGQVDESKAETFFREMFDEFNRSYAEDIQREHSRRYDNRLADEMVDRGIVDEEEAEKEDFDAEDYIDKFVDDMTDGQIKEGRGGYDYYESNFGEEEAKKIVLENNLIDISAAAEQAIKDDGVEHFLAGYDGNVIEVHGGSVWYRQN